MPTTRALKYRRNITWIALALIPPAIGIPLFHNFVTSPEVFHYSKYLSVGVMVLIVIYICRNKDEARLLRSNRKPQSKFKIVVAMPIGFLMFSFVIWHGLTISGPSVYARTFGDITVRHEYVKKKNTNSSRSCNYKIMLELESSLFFHHCISKEAFIGFPNGKFKAEIIALETPFGYLVKDVSYKDVH